VSEDLFLCGSKLLWGRLELGPGKVQVIGPVNGYKVEMGMRNFKADHGKPTSVTIKGLFDGSGYRPGEQQYARQVIIRNIKKPVDLQFGYHQCMAMPERKDVQKSKEPIILRYLI